MRLRRMAFALLLGTIGCGFVMLWPERPLWTQPFPACHALLQYSEDGKSLIVTEGLEENRALQPNPSLVYYDIASGLETKRIPLIFPEKTFIHNVWLSADAATIYAMTSTAVTAKDFPDMNEERYSRMYGGPGLLSSFDAATGRRLNGPFQGGSMSSFQVSPQRRWFCYTKPVSERSAFDMNIENLQDVINLVSTDDFRVRHSIPFDPASRTFHEFCFFEDDTKLAVLFTKWPRKTLLQLMEESPQQLGSLQQVLEVLDLKFGKVIQSFDLPTTHRWHKVLKAQDNQVYIKGDNCMLVVAFDSENHASSAVDSLHSAYPHLTPSPTSQPTTEYQEFEVFGHDWIAHCIHHDRNKTWEKGIQWIDDKCGTKLMNWYLPTQSICITDRHSGTKRMEIPAERARHLLISNDGHYLAQAAYEKPGLQLWNANPGPRWPYAMVAGVGIALLFLSLMRSLQRRSKDSPVQAINT